MKPFSFFLAALFGLGFGVTSYAADHLDGPRTIGDPAADITDVFAFPSPERPGHLVLIMNVHPLASAGTLFSDALDYTFIIRHARMRTDQDKAEGTGFATDREVRITCTADAPEIAGDGQPKTQRVSCTGGSEQPVVAVLSDSTANTDSSEATRLFVGLRSDPSFLDIPTLDSEFTLKETLPTEVDGSNSLQDANVLSIVLELDVHRLFGDDTLFAVAAEITMRGMPDKRTDRIGRAEVTNTFFAVPASAGLDDRDTLKDLYNSEASFDVLPENLGRYRDRIFASLFFYDRLDGRLDWRLEPGRLPIVDMLLRDHLVVDIAKPCGDGNGNYLEIERAVLRGEAHTSCGGRRPNDDVISVINTLMVEGLRMNPDKLIVVGVDAPTQWAETTWPYLAAPNSQRAKTATSVALNASCNEVWATIGEFGSLADWHPGVAKIKTGGQGAGEIRAVFLKNGKLIVEQLETMDVQQRQYTYTMLNGPLPVTDYRGMLRAQRTGNGCAVRWSSEFNVDGAPKPTVIDALNHIFSAGLDNLETLFGASAANSSASR